MVAYGLLPVLVAALMDNNSQRQAVIAESSWFHPFYALTFSLTGPGMFGRPGLEWAWIGASVSSLLLALLFLTGAARRVTKLSKIEPKPPLVRRIFEGLDRVFERSPLGFKLWVERGGVWDSNPFLWKEMRSRLTGKFRYFTRIGVLFLVGFAILITVLADDLADRDTIVAIYTILMILLMLASVGAGSGAFTQEKEDQKWDILLTTPMQPGSILRAKLAGAVAGVLHLVLMIGIFSVVARLFTHDPTRWWSEQALERAYAPLVVSTLIFSFFTISAGLLFSLWVRNTRKAYALTLLVVIVCLALFPVLLAVHAVVTNPHRGWSDIHTLMIRATNPFAQLEGVYGWRASEAWGGLMGHALVYLPLAGICLALCISRFNRLVGRAS
jgi:ABC-type transport system involved in multi-copper enzyme maturation permease subunit